MFSFIRFRRLKLRLEQRGPAIRHLEGRGVRPRLYKNVRKALLLSPSAESSRNRSKNFGYEKKRREKNYLIADCLVFNNPAAKY